ncbi:uncharacterized protein LOC128680598 [Plodia interpunctella]|uniref:uncharacterized protein LOC128680598 n=1 Tax=Plodia interpunctella TaxID=58824 RepID=UPI0023681424|nr:uncharacterized protein LOC128680598 [Plodia interpunctella]
MSFHNSVLIFLLVFSSTLAADYVNKLHKKPWLVRFYPKNTLFKKADLIDRGCTVFIKECPQVYKKFSICARHYDGKYKTFNNYCEMEFENCNSWRQWSMIKQVSC